MKNPPKILVAAPTAFYKEYIFLDWLLHVSNLSYPNYDILVVDNSHNEEYYQAYKNMGINILHVNPKGKTSTEYITESQSIIRDFFLKQKYTYLMSIEVDIFPPRNIIEKLLSNNKDIVSVPYFIGFGKQSNLITHYLRNVGIKEIEHYNPDFLEQFKRYNGKVNQCFSTGIGCSLIKRKVIKKIPFRFEKGKKYHSDTYFAIDLFNNQIPNYIDTSIVIKHYNSDWATNADFK